MSYLKEIEILNRYLKNKNLKHSNQRIVILEVFLESGKHCTADELYQLVKAKNSDIGQATVYRTLKLLCESGLCTELILDEDNIRYEPAYGHEHHDHLICTECGKFVEIISSDLEELQKKIVKKEGFILHKHRLNLYGLCGDCQK